MASKADSFRRFWRKDLPPETDEQILVEVDGYPDLLKAFIARQHMEEDSRKRIMRRWHWMRIYSPKEKQNGK